jgi:hypothetical protein
LSQGILAIRSLDISQASPFLERAWCKISAENPTAKLWVAGQPKDVSLPSYAQSRRWLLPDDARSSRATTVISWSIPNERTLEEAALFSGQQMVPGPLLAVYALADKRATKDLFARFGLPTPSSVVLDRGFTQGELIRPEFRVILEQQLASSLHYPIIMKPLWDCMGHGALVVRCPSQLNAAIQEVEGGRDLLIEEFIEGQAGSIEIFGEPGNYHFQPPCWTGSSSNGILSGFDALRISHPNLFFEVLTDSIYEAIAAMLSELSFRGACCVDFVTDGVDLFMLEVNPRVSGASCLSAAASGIDAYEATYRIARRQWSERLEQETAGGAAIQAGGDWVAFLKKVIDDAAQPIEWYRDGEINVDGITSPSAIVGGTAAVIEHLAERLKLMPPW